MSLKKKKKDSLWIIGVGVGEREKQLL